MTRPFFLSHYQEATKLTNSLSFSTGNVDNKAETLITQNPIAKPKPAAYCDKIPA